MTRKMMYIILTLDENGSPEFTEIKCKDLELNANMNIKFMSMESKNKIPYLLISTRNYTKDIIIDETNKYNDNTVSIHCDKQGDKNDE